MRHAMHTPTPSLRLYRLLLIRWHLSVPGIIALAGLMSSYAIRGLTPTSVASQPIVAAFDSYGPVWPLAFGIALGFLVFACVTKRGIAYAHLVTGSVMWLYAMALVFGSAFTGAGWGTASLALAISAASLLLARVYGRSN
jgi:hypothetical protein